MTREHFAVGSNHNLQLPDFCEPFHARVVAKTLTYHCVAIVGMLCALR